MWQNPSSSPTWEGNSYSITQEIPCILWNWKVIFVFTGPLHNSEYIPTTWPSNMHHTYVHVRSFTVITKDGGHAKWINTRQSMCSFFLIPCGLKALTWWKCIHILLLCLVKECSPPDRNMHIHKSTHVPVKICKWISDNSKVSVNVLTIYNTKKLSFFGSNIVDLKSNVRRSQNNNVISPEWAPIQKQNVV